MKRLFDIFVSLVVLIVLFPLVVLIAIIIKIDSKGSFLYFSERIGKDEKPFKLIKFRSMKPNSEKNGPLNVSLNDLRVTKFGKFLRSSKIDEIPQLINVLFGDMSLVGPRPDIRIFTTLYSKDEKKILSIKPGMTDWASIVNAFQYKEFKNCTDPDSFFIERIRPVKVKLQLYYLKHNNLFFDIEILFWTFIVVILRFRTIPKKIKDLL
jgi:lipopolysaccharide/colanic/teichoic acid biosynthesis glycosyltransferase